jgi:hypothetical protein
MVIFIDCFSFPSYSLLLFFSLAVFNSSEKGEKYMVAHFGFIWQLVSNRWLIRFKTFVSQSTTKLYN